MSIINAYVALRFAALLFFSLSPSARVPSYLIGEWSVGAPYDTPGPVGIDENQLARIRSFHIKYANDSIQVCGKIVHIESVTSKKLTNNKFLRLYGFFPRIIGFNSSILTEFTVNSDDAFGACGDFENPGFDVFVDDNHHVVIEVANGYFPLMRTSGRPFN